ncbi:glycosyltransferase family 1 protein [Whalleya microplaca]|nr:glycosyltransferase family 1 protein [Whalleya microplaca]
MAANQGQDMAPLVMSGARVTENLPLLVFTAAPISGHTGPVLQLAREFILRGYEIIFMTSPEFKASVEKIGAEWYECSPFFPPGSEEARQKVPVGLPRVVWDQENLFLASIRPRTARMRSLLEMIHERDPGRRVVIAAETFSLAILAFRFGAPLPKGYTKFPEVLVLNVIPLFVSSIDTAPFGPGLLPDSTESGRARNRLLNQLMSSGPLEGCHSILRQTLKDLACTSEPQTNLLDTYFGSYDVLFQLCSPSMDYPRSDLPLSIRYAGALPPRPVDPGFVFPSWWSEITTNAALPTDSTDKKKTIPISQGTINPDHTELLLPTINALAKRTDVLLIIILGVKGASFPAEIEIPPNTRVIDYFPYDAILRYADIFITNGGYGSFVHGAVNGVPMVMAGESEDKLETSSRGEYAGFAVNLRTQRPTPEAIYKGVEEILSNPTYKQRALRIRQDNLDLDAVHMIEKQIVASC